MAGVLVNNLTISALSLSANLSQNATNGEYLVSPSVHLQLTRDVVGQARLCLGRRMLPSSRAFSRTTYGMGGSF